VGAQYVAAHEITQDAGEAGDFGSVASDIGHQESADSAGAAGGAVVDIAAFGIDAIG